MNRNAREPESSLSGDGGERPRTQHKHGEAETGRDIPRHMHVHAHTHTYTHKPDLLAPHKENVKILVETKRRDVTRRRKRPNGGGVLQRRT